MARGQNPNSLANLKPPQFGEVRNPLGINRKRPYSDRHAQQAESPVPDSLRRKVNRKAGAEVLKAGATFADTEVLSQHVEAIVNPNSRALKEITDRIEGKPPQRMEIVGTERKEITLKVTFEKRIARQLE